jgi:hypothetical protein
VSQVNLLPPELLARQKTQRLTTLIVGGGIAALVLLVGFWFLQGQKLSSVNGKIAAQNATNAQIQQQITGLQSAQTLQTEATAQQALLQKAYVGEVSFSQMLLDLSRVIPSDAYLSAFTATLATSPTTTPPGAAASPAFVGSFTASGGAAGFQSLASWLTRLESVKGWVNPWLSSASETGPSTGLYTFSSGVDLTSDVLTGRGKAGATSGG